LLFIDNPLRGGQIPKDTCGRFDILLQQITPGKIKNRRIT
jgi:hypothetical protein